MGRDSNVFGDMCLDDHRLCARSAEIDPRGESAEDAGRRCTLYGGDAGALRPRERLRVRMYEIDGSEFRLQTDWMERVWRTSRCAGLRRRGAATCAASSSPGRRASAIARES